MMQPVCSSDYPMENQHPQFWSQQLEWSNPVFEDFENLNLESAHIRIAKEKNIQDANRWLLNYEPLRRGDLVLTMRDSDLKDWADAKVQECCRYAANKNQDHALENCRSLAERYGMKVFEKKIDFKYGIAPVLERFKDSAWWMRQVRKLAAREIEKTALTMGTINDRGQVYCSDYAVKKRQEQRKRNKELLETFEAVNNDGDVYTLAELSELSVSNPEIRRNELMVRLRGFEEVASAYSFDALFYTLTCPSKYHPSGKKYSGATPREANQYLASVWARIRAQFKREGIEVFGFRIAEPHKDGCPHWHLLLFAAPDDQNTITDTFFRHGLAEDGTEKGALKHRVTLEVIDPKKGSAVGYIAKYICKNIDGEYKNESGEAVNYDAKDIDGNYCGNSVDAAARVDAWSSLWGIRQFQQIGGPSVTVWRELRRMDTAEDEFDLFGGIVEKARAAADSSDWAAFCIVMGGCLLKRKDQEVKGLMFTAYPIDKTTGEIVVNECVNELNKYGEPQAGKLIGVMCYGIDYLTRFYEWDIQRKSIEKMELKATGLRVLSPPVFLGGLDLCQ